MARRSWMILGGVVLVLGLALAAGYELAPGIVDAAQHSDAAQVDLSRPGAQPVAAEPQAQIGGGWLGVQIANAEKVVTIVDVVADSPAAKAGVLKGDVITSVNGNAITNTKQLVGTIGAMKAGDKATLGIQRGGASQTIEVTLGARPAPQMPKRFPVVPNPLGGLEGLIPDLSGLPADQRFDHFVGGTFSFTDKNGSPVTLSITAGEVTTVTASTVSIRPNGGGAEATYQVGSSTKVFPGKRGQLTDTVKVGDKVIVVAKQGSTEALALYAPAVAGAHKLVPPMRKPAPGNNATPKSEFRDRFRQGLGSLGHNLDQLRQRLEQGQRPAS